MWDALCMGTAPVALAAIALASCSRPEQRKHEALMDQVEKQAKLPKTAASLNNYARLYSDGGKGQVIAVYMLPSLIEKAAAQKCDQLASDFSSKRVPCISGEVRGIAAGERRWVSNQADLPFEVAPGCQVITLAFDVSRQHIDELSCVGDRPVNY
jgi:hypothetical protein